MLSPESVESISHRLQTRDDTCLRWLNTAVLVLKDVEATPKNALLYFISGLSRSNCVLRRVVMRVRRRVTSSTVLWKDLTVKGLDYNLVRFLI